MKELEIVREKIQNKYRVVKTDEDLEWNRAFGGGVNEQRNGCGYI